MPFKFAEDAAAQAEVKRFAAGLYGPMLAELEAMAQRAQAAGRPFLFGDHFGPVDAYALTLLRWGGFAGFDPTGFPAMWAHVQKVAQLPAVARAMAPARARPGPKGGRPGSTTK